MRTWMVCACVLLGCSAPEQGEISGDPPAHSVGQFLVWEPGSDLIPEHINWHTQPCETSGGRRCTNRGEDFLQFHTDYVNRLREAYAAQGLTANITPWYTLPPEMKDPANGWSTSLQNAENAIKSLIDPLTGRRFASFNRFGQFLEGQYHNALHGIARRAYGESVVGGFMSPSSTYFFKIHGLVEWHKRRFLNGDFNKDSHSDLVVQDQNELSIWAMSGSKRLSTQLVAPTEECNWTVGASADLNYDTQNDLIVHSKLCERTQAWLMQGTTRLSVTELAPQSAAFTLLGAADFNGDQRPDLVWEDSATKDVSIWLMHGLVSGETLSVDIPDTWSPSVVADVNDNGYPDIVLTRVDEALNQRLYAVLYGAETGFGTPPQTINGLSTNPLRVPVGVGRFHTIGAAADLVVRYLPADEASAGEYDLRYLTSFSSGGRPNYGSASIPVALPSRATTVQGPR